MILYHVNSSTYSMYWKYKRLIEQIFYTMMQSPWTEITSPLVTYLVTYNEFCNFLLFYSEFCEMFAFYLFFNHRYVTCCAVMRYTALLISKMELSFSKALFFEGFLFKLFSPELLDSVSCFLLLCALWTFTKTQWKQVIFNADLTSRMF